MSSFRLHSAHLTLREGVCSDGKQKGVPHLSAKDERWGEPTGFGGLRSVSGYGASAVAAGGAE